MKVQFRPKLDLNITLTFTLYIYTPYKPCLIILLRTIVILIEEEKIFLNKRLITLNTSRCI